MSDSGVSSANSQNFEIGKEKVFSPLLPTQRKFINEVEKLAAPPNPHPNVFLHPMNVPKDVKEHVFLVPKIPHTRGSPSAEETGVDGVPLDLTTPPAKRVCRDKVCSACDYIKEGIPPVNSSNILWREYVGNPYPTSSVIMKLNEVTKITPRKIKAWFNNQKQLEFEKAIPSGYEKIDGMEQSAAITSNVKVSQWLKNIATWNKRFYQ